MIPVPPEYDLPLAEKSGKATIILAGGCFSGIQAIFQHVKGVTNVTAGYTGGLASTANHAKVTGDGTGHAESVLVEYDPAKLSVGTLLRIYFFVAHDPTQLNRQGPDVGTQYRSTIFTDSVDEKRVTVAYMSDRRAEAAAASDLYQDAQHLPVLSGRGLPPELRAEPSDAALRDGQRPAEGATPQGSLPEALARAASALRAGREQAPEAAAAADARLAFMRHNEKRRSLIRASPFFNSGFRARQP